MLKSGHLFAKEASAIVESYQLSFIAMKTFFITGVEIVMVRFFIPVWEMHM